MPDRVRKAAVGAYDRCKKLISVPFSMKTTKINIPSGIAKSHTAAAVALHVTPRTIRDLKAEGLPGFRADGTVNLDLLYPAYLARKKKSAGSESLKDRKIRVECETKELALAAKRRELISRSWMAERIHAAAGKVDAFRLKSEAEHPLLFAAHADNVPACREIVRKIWDEIMASMNSLESEFRE